jgi:hypothetical protein
MNIQTIITEIRNSLTDTFLAIDSWFDKDENMRKYRPADGGWTIDEILEHIGLTNRFLIILINKGTNKALQNIHNLDITTELQNHSFNWDKLAQIGKHKSFTWIRPAHMEPTGTRSGDEVRNELKEQITHCLDNLDKLKNGEGMLYKTTMTVNSLGKINVYEYIYFLAQHGLRHIGQMEKIEAEFTKMPRATH